MSLGLSPAVVVNLARPVAREAGLRLVEAIWEANAEFAAAVLLDLHKFTASCAAEEWNGHISEPRLQAMRDAAKRLHEITPEKQAELRALHIKAKAELEEQVKHAQR